MAHSQSKEKGVNVQVLVRCRPCSSEELKTNVPQVVCCDDQRKEVTVYQHIAGKQIDRTFTFDKVFGPTCRQMDLYNEAIIPIVNEVLEGFNCTIFAYGQTGTGKTYTMEGAGRRPKDGTLPGEAGVIPRAVQQIFECLESQKAEYSVKVTFLELYNEEITDLLAPEADILKVPVDDKKKLALMEDGKGGVLVRGLEEEIVKNAAEIFSLLDRGSAKRRTAETLLNKQSSRSHSVFSVTIHIKEPTPEGEELIKCGKLNLVDLAGSENISRSGAGRADGRAREAGEINKSLLTLGRVITALVEHLGHIPYRDSKLTRLLRDSLGGRTKTCIIATVSPTVHCLEETLSTLDYAHRAKNIKNKPEVNQKMTKSALIKDMNSEIDRLKSELYAAREKNGIYLPKERYFEEEAQRKAMAEKIEQLEGELETKEKSLEDLQETCDKQKEEFEDLSSRHNRTTQDLLQTQENLAQTKDQLAAAQFRIRERDYVITRHNQAEEALAKRAGSLRKELKHTTEDVNGLFAKIDRKVRVEESNKEVGTKFRSGVSGHLTGLQEAVAAAVGEQHQQYAALDQKLQLFMTRKEKELGQLASSTASLRSVVEVEARRALAAVERHSEATQASLEKIAADEAAHAASLQNAVKGAAEAAEATLASLKEALDEQERQLCAFAAQQREAVVQGLQASKTIASCTRTALQALEKSARECAAGAERRHVANDQTLAGLATDFQRQTQQEEQELVASVTSLVASMLTRHRKLVTSRVASLQGALASGSTEVATSLASMAATAGSANGEMAKYQKEAEADGAARLGDISTSHCLMMQHLTDSSKHTEVSSQHWKESQESWKGLQDAHTTATSSQISEVCKEIEGFKDSEEEAQASAVAEGSESHRKAIAQLQDAHEEDCAGIEAVREGLQAQDQSLADFKAAHKGNVEQAQVLVDTYFDKDLQEDLPTAETPRKRVIAVPEKAAIKQLRTPTFEVMVQDFRGKNAPPNGLSKVPLPLNAGTLDDGRPPLGCLESNKV